MNETEVRLGVDIGGTFTDVVLERGSEVFSVKVLTTPSAPEDAILQAVAQALAKARLSPGDISVIIHGTTLATNALIERRGANTALITTQGFRDVIEMRSESRFEQYDLNLVLPEPLISRAHRYTLAERIGADGGVLKSLDPAEMELLAGQIEQGGYDSVAVGLIHSYMNPRHEELVREILLARMPELSVSISSEVSPQMREFERFNTVCANAYVKPLMKSYLDRLVLRLYDMGASCPVFMMHSGGGIISLESASEFPVRLVESGPAGGAIFAAHIAGRYGIDAALSFDMGGTTAKICLIKDQTPKTSTTFEVARTYRFKKGSGMPISIPVIEMVEIGAGGGSLAHIDSLQQIRVGPESAGSEPGPACYQQGGERPAVTDADLLLGRLDPDNFAGGSIKLSSERSASAVEQHVGTALGLDQTTAAFGISEVVDENMANAARVHAVENGEDLSGFTMIAFGGAAPLHAGRLCEKLGIERLLVPPGAGVGSAIGFLRAAFSFEATRSTYMRLSAYDPGAVRSVLDELAQEAEAFVRSCDKTSPLTYERKAYMRFVGQGWEIPVLLSEADYEVANSSAITERFETAYQALFGRTVEGLDIEVTSWSVRVSTPVRPVAPVETVSAQGKVASEVNRSIYDPVGQKFDEAAVIERNALNSGMAVAGPAVIVESETSIIVPVSFEAVMQPDGCLLLGRKASAAQTEGKL